METAGTLEAELSHMHATLEVGSPPASLLPAPSSPLSSPSSRLPTHTSRFDTSLTGRVRGRRRRGRQGRSRLSFPASVPP